MRAVPIVAVRGIVACGLLAGAAASAADRSAPPATSGPGGQMSCDDLARMPNAPMSVEACRQMMGATQSYQAAASDPGAARPGDDAMTCSDIAAEMRTLQGVGLSEGQQRENAAAATAYQATLAKQQAEVNALGVEATAAVNAAAAADTATEVATGGLVKGRAAAATGAAYQARATAMGERMAEERKPEEQRLSGAMGTSAQAMGQSMQSNPRFARLVQLAIAKDCKEPGTGDPARTSYAAPAPQGH